MKKGTKLGNARPGVKKCFVVVVVVKILLSFRFLPPILVYHSRMTVEQSDKIDNFHVKGRV